MLVELQKYILTIDKYHLNILTKDYREKYFEKTIKEVKENSGKIFLAKNNQKIIGAIIGYISPYDEYDKVEYSCPKKAIISELIVSHGERNLGVGQKLLDYAEKYFKSVDCEYISIELFAYNRNAEKFYRKNNYENRCINLFKKL